MVFRPSAPMALETLPSTVLGSCCPLVAAHAAKAAKITEMAIFRNIFILLLKIESKVVGPALSRPLPPFRAGMPAEAGTAGRKACLHITVKRRHRQYRLPPQPHTACRFCPDTLWDSHSRYARASPPKAP